MQGPQLGYQHEHLLGTHRAQDPISPQWHCPRFAARMESNLVIF